MKNEYTVGADIVVGPDHGTVSEVVDGRVRVHLENGRTIAIDAAFLETDGTAEPETAEPETAVEATPAPGTTPSSEVTPPGPAAKDKPAKAKPADAEAAEAGTSPPKSPDGATPNTDLQKDEQIAEMGGTQSA